MLPPITPVFVVVGVHDDMPDHMEPGQGMTSTTVYWPRQGIRQDRGLAVGWKIEDVAVVVGLVDEWVGTDLSSDYRRFSNVKPRWQQK